MVEWAFKMIESSSKPSPALHRQAWDQALGGIIAVSCAGSGIGLDDPPSSPGDSVILSLKSNTSLSLRRVSYPIIKKTLPIPASTVKNKQKSNLKYLFLPVAFDATFIRIFLKKLFSSTRAALAKGQYCIHEQPGGETSCKRAIC